MEDNPLGKPLLDNEDHKQTQNPSKEVDSSRSYKPPHPPISNPVSSIPPLSSLPISERQSFFERSSLLKPPQLRKSFSESSLVSSPSSTPPSTLTPRLLQLQQWIHHPGYPPYLPAAGGSHDHQKDEPQQTSAASTIAENLGRNQQIDQEPQNGVDSSPKSPAEGTRDGDLGNQQKGQKPQNGVDSSMMNPAEGTRAGNIGNQQKDQKPQNGVDSSMMNPAEGTRAGNIGNQQIDQEPQNGVDSSMMNPAEGTRAENIGGGGGGDNSQSLPLPNTEVAREGTAGPLDISKYHLEIVSIDTAFKVRIRNKSQLDDLWKLVLERRELNKFIRGILNSGRDYARILGGVGVLVLMFSAITNAEVAGDISFGKRMVIFALFSIIFVLYMIVTLFQLDNIYDPALNDAREMYATLLRKTNFARRSLLVPNNSSSVVSSSVEEGVLKDLFDDYCKEIGKPLPIGSGRLLTCIEVVCVILFLLIVFVLTGTSQFPKKQLNSS